MALITLTSASGSPGVTTTALGLALSWHRPAVLVDADPTGSMAVPAGYLRGAAIPEGHSVVDLAISLRQNTLGDDLPGTLLDIPGGNGAKLLCGPAKHTQARVLDPLWEPLATTLRGLESNGQDAIVDAGRLGLDGSPMRLITASDLCLLVVRSNLPALIAATSWAQTLRDAFARVGASSSLGLVVVDPGRPYGVTDIAKSLGIPVVATLPWDPETAQQLSWGSPAPSRGLLAKVFKRDKGLQRALLAAVEASRTQLDTNRALLATPNPEGNVSL